MSTAPSLTACSAEDILAYIPHALGYWPGNSLVVITVAENQLRATMRLDLPVPQICDDAETEAVQLCRGFARQAAAALAADTQADSTVAVLYSDEPWPDPAMAPHSGLVSELADRLGATGMPLRESWIVTEQWWRNYFCSGAGYTSERRPLTEIYSSALNVELIYRGSSYAASLADAIGVSPGTAQVQSPEVRRWHEHYSRALSGCWQQKNQFFASLQLWQRLLETSPEEEREDSAPGALHSSEVTGFLLASLECRNLRDTLLVQSGMGAGPASEGIRSCGWFDTGSGEVVLPAAAVDMAVPSQAFVDSDRFGGSGAESDPDAEKQFCEVLIGTSAESPNWPSLDRAFELFAGLVQQSTGTSSAALLTMLAWIEWHRGRGSRADHLLGQALKVEPDYKLAALLSELLGRGTISRWALSPETAWRRTADRPSPTAPEEEGGRSREKPES